jgi:hypothetical protein
MGIGLMLLVAFVALSALAVMKVRSIAEAEEREIHRMTDINKAHRGWGLSEGDDGDVHATARLTGNRRTTPRD